jgi:hypothetical protein
MSFLFSLFPFLAKEAVNNIVQTVTSKKPDEIKEEDLTSEQKFQMVEMASKMQSQINRTMREESKSEHFLVRSWRPTTIYGLGALVIAITVLHQFGGVYFLFKEKELWQRFRDLIELNERSTNLLMTGFFALCGIYFPLRSAEKGTFGKIIDVFKK